MKCKTCGHEEKEIETKEFNGLIVRPIEQFGVSFKRIVIPRGWRLPTVQEGIDLINNDDFFEWSQVGDDKHDFFCQQPFKRNKGIAAWFACNNSYLNLLAFSNLNYYNAARGVLLVKDGGNKCQN